MYLPISKWKLTRIYGVICVLCGATATHGIGEQFTIVSSSCEKTTQANCMEMAYGCDAGVRMRALADFDTLLLMTMAAYTSQPASQSYIGFILYYIHLVIWFYDKQIKLIHHSHQRCVGVR